jgi:hypothetical protein
MKKLSVILTIAALSAAVAPAAGAAQTAIPTQVGSGADQPAAGLIFGTSFMVGDFFNGWQDYVDAGCNSNQFAQCTVDPNTSTQLVPDTTFFATRIGGHTGNPNSDCNPFCQMGGASPFDASGVAFITSNDKGNGGVIHQTVAGLYRVTFPSQVRIIGTKFGLGGNGPAAAAIEVPNSTVLFVNLGNGNILRFHCAYAADGDPCQSVETVGGNPNGSKSRSLAVVPNGSGGLDLYVAHANGLSRVLNVTGCRNNQGGCGNAVAVNDGLQGQEHTGLATDGANLYMTIGSTVYGYDPVAGTKTIIGTGYSFCAGKPSMIFLSGGNLWWGDDPSCGAQVGTGRFWRVAL